MFTKKNCAPLDELWCTSTVFQGESPKIPIYCAPQLQRQSHDLTSYNTASYIFQATSEPERKEKTDRTSCQTQAGILNTHHGVT